MFAYVRGQLTYIFIDYCNIYSCCKPSVQAFRIIKSTINQLIHDTMHESSDFSLSSAKVECFTPSHLSSFRTRMLQHMPSILIRSREALFRPTQRELARRVWTVIAPGVWHGVPMLLLEMTVQIFLVLEAGPVAGLDGALERAGVRFLMLATLRYAG